MTTKTDCYHRALPGEPRFTLLGRDPEFYNLVSQWANQREMDIHMGKRPRSDYELVDEARALAREAAVWRADHDGEWRK